MDQSRESVESYDLSYTIQKSARDLRKEGEFCDFTIVVNGKRFAAHKLILAGSSDYFKVMLKHSNSIESRTNECPLEDIAPNIMKRILDFCYTSRIVLDAENVQEILIAASRLQIGALQSLCVEFIMKRVDITNCLGVLVTADRCNLPILIESALHLCLAEFKTISELDEFFQLDAGVLTRIISHDHLSVAKEEEVLSAVLKWITADKDRVRELDNLAQHVRFVFFNPTNLVYGTWDDRVLKSNKCRELIDEAIDYNISGAPPPEQRSQVVAKRFKPRCPLNRQQRIFAVGGRYGDAGRDSLWMPSIIVEKYDPYSDWWVEVKKMRTPRHQVGVTILDDCLYVVGGEGGHGPLRSVECYSIKDDLWRYGVADMQFRRADLGVCALRGYLYAIGGHGCWGPSNFVERYNPRSNRWEEFPCLHQPRSGAGVAVCNDSIYVVGGFSYSHKPRNTVERFDGLKWSFVAPMTTGREYFGCTTFQGKIYVVGGLDEHYQYLNTGECYDPVEDRWEPIPSMNNGRSYFALVEIDGLLYAIQDGIMEAYDPVRKEWTSKCNMIYTREGVGFALYSPMKQNSPQKCFHKSTSVIKFA